MLDIPWFLIDAYEKLTEVAEKIFTRFAKLIHVKNRKTAAAIAWTLLASVLIGIFVATSGAQAQTVTNCTNIGVLQNGGFERPLPGLPINSSGGTYPSPPAYQATPPQFGGIYRELGNQYYNYTDAYADTSTYRTYVNPGQPNDERVYWYTTESDNGLELTAGGSSYNNITPANGARFIELNANVNAGIFQDLATVPGEVMRWSLKHASRSNGAETMQVSIGNPTNNIAAVLASTPENGDGDSTSEDTRSTIRSNAARAGLVVQSAIKVGTNTPTTTISDSTNSWSTWYGAYTDTNTTNSTTRLFFEATGTSVGGSGNELDSIIFSPVAACPITRELNSPASVATINPFDTSTSSYAIVPNESGSSESVTALTKVSGPGSAVFNSGNMTFQFTPNGSGTTTYTYTLSYTANGLTSTSDGTMTIVARDPYGYASCNPGSVETATSTVGSQTLVIEKFKTPVQANTDTPTDHSSATCTWTAPDNVYAVDYLLVGGGGGGAGGGGGGGGVVTSMATYLGTNNALRTSASNPLAVTPGQTINITVGGGGARGWGGSYRCSSGSSTTSSCTQPTRTASNGSSSSFGSVSAQGGGAGGTYDSSGNHNGPGGTGGSGGGAAADSNKAAAAVAALSQVIGAQSFGNRGGLSDGTAYAAGGGGGGAGTVDTTTDTPDLGNGGGGGTNRLNTATASGGAQAGCLPSISGCSGANSTHGSGGHGGRGVKSTIADLNSSTYLEYGCGGGAGINDNSNNNIPSMQAKGGCSSAGDGSSWATFLTTTTNTYPVANPYPYNNAVCTSLGTACSGGNVTSVQFNGTEVPTEGFGGGGAGTDPEGDHAGSGGSGIVIIRYLVPNVNCPNSTNNSAVTGPIACPYPITITAGSAIQTSYNLTWGDATNGYFSYPGTPTDTITINNIITNGTDTVTTTISGGSATFRLSNPTSALVGATYPIQYTIYSGGQTSTSYVLLKIADPNQHTPVRIPVDPRWSSVRLPIIRVGTAGNVQVCFTPRVDSTNSGYSHTPNVVRLDSAANETTVASSVAGQLIIQGTNSALQSGLAFIQVNASGGDSRLIPHLASRFIDINVSNTTAGGNGSCTFGTSTVVQLVPIAVTEIQGHDVSFYHPKKK